MNNNAKNTAVIATIFSAFVITLSYYLVPKYITVFTKYNLDIPLQTQIVIATYKYWIILPLIPLAIAIKANNHSLPPILAKYAYQISIAIFIFAWALLMLTAFAFYEPVNIASSKP